MDQCCIQSRPATTHSNEDDSHTPDRVEDRGKNLVLEQGDLFKIQLAEVTSGSRDLPLWK